MRRRAPGLLAVPLVLLVAACGGATSTVTHEVTQVVTATAPQTTTRTTSSAAPPGTTTTTTTPATTTATTPETASTTAPTTSTSTSTSTSTTPSSSQVRASVPCTAASLTPAFLGSSGATGNVVLTFALRNRGRVACRTYGFPGVQFVSETGTPLSTAVTHTTQDLLGSTPVSELVIAPGQEASFRIVAADMGAGGGTSGCRKVDAVMIIAPDDTTQMRVAIAAGSQECGGIGVSPMLAGSDALPGV